MRTRLLLAAVVAASAAACSGSPDSAPPLATPAVSVNHTRVPLGSPIEVTYRFQVAPGATFDRDYRVLVHFLDADDELMWTDDHQPPRPTSAWKAGQAIEYTRTVFVPLYPYVGDATIAVGLYAPGTNERAPLAGDSMGQRAYRVARMQLQPQTDNIFLAYLDGWHAPETPADNPSVEWQWTRKEGVLRFRNPKRNAVFYLHYDGQPSVFDTPQTVTISVGAEVIDTFQVSSPDEAIRKIAIKSAQFGPDDVVTLRISVDKTFMPALVTPGSRDSRELGIRVFHVFVEPR